MNLPGRKKLPALARERRKEMLRGANERRRSWHRDRSPLSGKLLSGLRPQDLNCINNALRIIFASSFPSEK